MISNTAYEVANTAVDLINYWRPRLSGSLLKTVDPVYEYTENLKDYYRYLAWIDETITPDEDYL